MLLSPFFLWKCIEFVCDLIYKQDVHTIQKAYYRIALESKKALEDFTKELQEKPTKPPIPSESQNGLKNAKYTIAMARTNNPDSATAQFFINVRDNAMLDYPSRDGFGYTVFGKVISGFETVENIKFAPTTVMNRMADVPSEPIVIQSATVQK